MPSFRQVTIVLLLIASLVSCKRDPNTAKKKYLESGNAYFDQAKYKYAAIQYQNAIKSDQRFGIAYYKLGMVNLKTQPPSVGSALRNFRRAIELLKDQQAYQQEYKQSLVQLAQLNLEFLKDDKIARKEVGDFAGDLIKRDPNSFDGYRLMGDFTVRRALQEREDLTPAIADKSLAEALEYYRKADTIKPGDAGIAIQIGSLLADQKHYAEAETSFRKAIDIDKTNPTAYRKMYQLYRVQDKNAEAEQLLKEAVQNNPKTYLYLVNLAQFYRQMGRQSDMLNMLQQVKSHAKDIPMAYKMVGDFYVRMGDYDAALSEFREGVAKDSANKTKYQHSIVEALSRQGKKAEANEVNRQILKENPKDPDANSFAATVMIATGDINNALAKLQAVVTSDPDNAVAHYQLARAYVASGRNDSREAARQQYELAIAKRPDMNQPKLGLAALEVNHGEYQAALDLVKDVLKTDPNSFNAKLIESQAFLGEKKYGESDALLAGMMKSNANSPSVFFQAGTNAMAQGKPDAAAGAFMRAYELNPSNSKALLGLVDADMQRGKLDAAMQLLTAESKKNPNRLDLVFLMGTTSISAGKLDDALGYFNKMLNGLKPKDPTRADVYLQIAKVDLLKGNRDAAISNIQKARDFKPDNEQVLIDLGWLLSQAGRQGEAKQAYQAALKVGPNNVRILNELAYLLAETNSELDQAMNYAQRAKSLAPNDPDISDTLAWVLLKKQLTEPAISIFKDLASHYPTNPTYHYHLAAAYKQRGDNARALEEAREALKHNPTPDEQRGIQQLISSSGGK